MTYLEFKKWKCPRIARSHTLRIPCRRGNPSIEDGSIKGPPTLRFYSIYIHEFHSEKTTTVPLHLERVHKFHDCLVFFTCLVERTPNSNLGSIHTYNKHVSKILNFPVCKMEKEQQSSHKDVGKNKICKNRRTHKYHTIIGFPITFPACSHPTLLVSIKWHNNGTKCDYKQQQKAAGLHP
jgi:hypothetical protein